jgi:hypothetical protein
MDILASLLNYFKKITASPSEERNSSDLEINMEIRCDQ